MKWFIAIDIVLTLLVGTVLLFVWPRAPILTGYASRMACTCHFMQHRTIEDIQATDLSFNLFPYVSLDVNESGKSVTASLFGMAPKTSVQRDGLGCVLIQGKDDHQVKMPKLSPVKDNYTWQISSKLTHAQKIIIDSLFFKGTKTRSALIIHKDSIIYESYAAGFDEDTPLLGWSMSKSVMSTLVGMMVGDGLLDVQDAHLFANWKDDRAKITIEDLLQMRTGLDWDENYSKVSSATKMLFDADDVVQSAASVGCEAPIRTHWEYSSGTTNLLSGVMRQRSGSIEQYLKYPKERLFEPLGMSSAWIEVDAAGNFIGSSYMFADTRDWAKYGLLYLHNGNWQGQSILDSSWVAKTFEAEPLSKGKYGYQFWHNKGGVELPNAPQDLIFADGYQGQRIFVMPSQDLVIVRLGLDNIDFDKVLSATINMIK